MPLDLKIRIKFSPGLKNVSIFKLALQMERMASLAEAVARDLGINAPISEWTAENFRNSSVAYDMKYYSPVSEGESKEFIAAFHSVIDFNPKKTASLPRVSTQTIVSVNALAQTFSDEEKAYVMLPNPGKGRQKRVHITRQRLEKINTIPQARDLIPEYDGAIIGYLHEWNIGSKQPFIKIRDVVTNDLVKCLYKNKDRQTIARLFEKSDQLIIVYGRIHCDLITGKPEVKDTKDFELAPEFKKDFYKNFPGMLPEIIGDADAAEYIRGLRDGGQ